MTSNRANLYFMLTTLPADKIVGGIFKINEERCHRASLVGPIREYCRPIPYTVRSAVVR